MKRRQDADRRHTCQYCAAPAIVAVQRAEPRATITVTASVHRWQTWATRYLCAAHEHCDPWQS